MGTPVTAKMEGRDVLLEFEDASEFFGDLRLKIGPRLYWVAERDKMPVGLQDADGYCDDSGYILLKKGLDAGRTLSVLWHEIIHAWDFERGIVSHLRRMSADPSVPNHDVEEYWCDQVANIVATTLVDNPELVEAIESACQSMVGGGPQNRDAAQTAKPESKQSGFLAEAAGVKSHVEADSERRSGPSASVRRVMAGCQGAC